MIVNNCEIRLNTDESSWQVFKGDKKMNQFFFTPRDAADKVEEKKNAIKFARTVK